MNLHLITLVIICLISRSISTQQTYETNYYYANNEVVNYKELFKSSTPEQIHLSLGRTQNEMVVTWTTFSPSDTSYVQFGVNQQLNQLVKGYSRQFVPYNAPDRKLIIHRAFLKNLKPSTIYHYRVGCATKKQWSEEFSFKTFPDGTNWSPRMLVFGDLGVGNDRSIPFIQKEVDSGNADLVFHNGDFAYDMDDDDSKRGDDFMNLIQPIAARLPYQTSPGNHEAETPLGNFSNYRERFSMYDMPGAFTRPRADHFYAFYLGPALIISFSTEIYYFTQHFNQSNIDWQNEWIESVLRQANLPANRAKHPWVITFGHRPMYCTNDLRDDDCSTWAKVFQDNLESMFHKYGVDLSIWAHEHCYERTYPVYRSQLSYNSSSFPYTNPLATVHVVTGAAGNTEGLDQFDRTQPWSAFRQIQYGYAFIRILNETHLIFEQKNSGGDMAGYVIDAFTLIQERHGSFENRI